MLTNVLVGALLVFILLLIISLIKPTLFKFIFRGKTSRLTTSTTFILLGIVTFVAIGLTTPKKNSTENTSASQGVVTKPRNNEDIIWGQLFQGALANVAVKYSEAQIYTDALLHFDPSSTTREDWMKLAETTKEKWAEAEKASEEFNVIADAMPNYEVPKMKSTTSFNLIQKAYAADPGYREFFKHKEDIQKDQEYMEKLNLVDMAPGKERVKTAAKLFNTDIKSAKNIVDNMYAQVSVNNSDIASIADFSSKSALAIDSASQVALFIGGLYTGASEMALLAQANKLKFAVNAINTVVNGFNLTINLSDNNVQMGIASKDGASASIANLKNNDILKQVNTLFSIRDLTKALSNYSKIKETIGKGYNGVISSKSINTFLKREEDVKAIADKVKEDGMDNLKTTYDWAAWMAAKGGENYADMFEIQGPTTVGISQGNTQNINPNVQQVVLNTGTIPITMVMQNGKVIGVLTPYEQLAPTTPKTTDNPNGSLTETKKVNYDGAYTGSDSVANGIANAIIRVSGGQLSGSGTYKQTVEGYSFKMSVSISGVLFEEGRVSGSLSASGSYGGQSYGASGKFSGKIEDGVMKISYSASGSAGTGSGSMNLYK